MITSIKNILSKSFLTLIISLIFITSVLSPVNALVTDDNIPPGCYFNSTVGDAWTGSITCSYQKQTGDSVTNVFYYGSVDWYKFYFSLFNMPKSYQVVVSGLANDNHISGNDELAWNELVIKLVKGTVKNKLDVGAKYAMNTDSCQWIYKINGITALLKSAIGLFKNLASLLLSGTWSTAGISTAVRAAGCVVGSFKTARDQAEEFAEVILKNGGNKNNIVTETDTDTRTKNYQIVTNTNHYTSYNDYIQYFTSNYNFAYDIDINKTYIDSSNKFYDIVNNEYNYYTTTNNLITISNTYNNTTIVNGTDTQVIYYLLPDGSSSRNLTEEEALNGFKTSLSVDSYSNTYDDDDLVALYHFDKNQYNSAYPIQSTLIYSVPNSIEYVNNTNANFNEALALENKFNLRVNGLNNNDYYYSFRINPVLNNNWSLSLNGSLISSYQSQYDTTFTYNEYFINTYQRLNDYYNYSTYEGYGGTYIIDGARVAYNYSIKKYLWQIFAYYSTPTGRVDVNPVQYQFMSDDLESGIEYINSQRNNLVVSNNTLFSSFRENYIYTSNSNMALRTTISADDLSFNGTQTITYMAVSNVDISFIPCGVSVKGVVYSLSDYDNQGILTYMDSSYQWYYFNDTVASQWSNWTVFDCESLLQSSNTRQYNYINNRVYVSNDNNLVNSNMWNFIAVNKDGSVYVNGVDSNIDIDMSQQFTIQVDGDSITYLDELAVFNSDRSVQAPSMPYDSNVSYYLPKTMQITNKYVIDGKYYQLESVSVDSSLDYFNLSYVSDVYSSVLNATFTNLPNSWNVLQQINFSNSKSLQNMFGIHSSGIKYGLNFVGSDVGNIGNLSLVSTDLWLNSNLYIFFDWSSGSSVTASVWNSDSNSYLINKTVSGGSFYNSSYNFNYLLYSGASYDFHSLTLRNNDGRDIYYIIPAVSIDFDGYLYFIDHLHNNEIVGKFALDGLSYEYKTEEVTTVYEPVNNQILIQSLIGVDGWKFGGIRPSNPNYGSVYCSVDEVGNITSIQQFNGIEWISVKGSLYNHELGRWINAIGFNIFNSNWDYVDSNYNTDSNTTSDNSLLKFLTNWRDGLSDKLDTMILAIKNIGFENTYITDVDNIYDIDITTNIDNLINNVNDNNPNLDLDNDKFKLTNYTSDLKKLYVLPQTVIDGFDETGLSMLIFIPFIVLLVGLII